MASRVKRGGFVLAAVFGVVGCTIVPYEAAAPSNPVAPAPNTSDEEPLQVPVPVVVQESTSKKAASLPAAQRMRVLAQEANGRGDHQRSLAMLERALRIDPRDPQTYFELARTRLLLEQPEEALQLAQRGLSLQPGTTLRIRLERVVDKCREALSA